jgi:predicted GNAT family acetyltransferase
LWEADGRPVACALERTFRTVGSRVTTVFTARDQRGRGYGSAITAALSQRVLDSGRWCVLFADAHNPHTNRIYQRLGYQFQAVYSDIHFADD